MTEAVEQAVRALVLKAPGNIIARYIEDVPLFFAKKATDIDPKRGLAIHGPVDAKEGGPETIRLGIISSAEGVEETTTWALYCNEHPIQSTGEQPFLAQTFPGFVKAFNSKLLLSPDYNEVLTTREISDVLKVKNPNLRIKKAAERYASKVNVVARRASRPDVVICHEPSDIELRCGAGLTRYERSVGSLPKQASDEAARIRKNIEGVVELLAPLDEETQDLLDSTINQDFRAQLKAKCLEHDIPIQILTQSVLEAMLPKSISMPTPSPTKRRGEDPSTIAWNIATAIYCKADHSPWKVDFLKPGACYIGVSFYYDKTSRSKNMHASLAQIFSDTGEGIVVRSDSFKWDSKALGTPHLDRKTASRLLSDAIKVYKEHHNNQVPNRVVVHKRSRYDADELQGFADALSQADVPRYDLLWLTPDPRDLFIYRNGDNPVVRGTTLRLGDGSHLVYTIGYIPYLNSYPHPRVPRPLDIREHKGDTPPDELAREIIALTRLNWNSSNYCSFWPATLMFSHRVGEILGRVQAGAKIQQNYYFYM
jgi:hypothetical protein